MAIPRIYTTHTLEGYGEFEILVNPTASEWKSYIDVMDTPEARDAFGKALSVFYKAWPQEWGINLSTPEGALELVENKDGQYPDELVEWVLYKPLTVVNERREAVRKNLGLFSVTEAQ